jgi:hypothetical protein
MRRLLVVALATLMLLLVGAAPAGAVTLANGVVFEFRQTTAAYEQSVVTYEAVVRNESTQMAGFGRLYLDVPTGFGEVIQYYFGLCRPYENQDVDCHTVSLPPGEQVVYTFQYIVRATPGDYPITATLDLSYDPNPPPLVTLSVVTSVQPSVELQVAWSQLARAGEIVRRATVRSFGTSTAVGVVLTVTWRSERGTVQPVSITPSQGTCAPPSVSSTQCALGELDPYAIATVDLVFPRRAARGLTTTAQVTSDTYDVDPSTNTATLRT